MATAGTAPFVPTVAQVRYLQALRDALEEGRRVSDRAICPRLRMSRATLWDWRQDPRFALWLGQELKAESDFARDLVIARHTALAIKGSTRSAEFLLRARALAAGRAGPSSETATVDARQYQVNLLVPRPPNLAGE
ncbi:MAG: hypothetical protein Q8L86_19535 [Vicinamibacterales bacterium]|nr:hypothetical protein [Vicinamibacterales bacterium]